MLPLYDDKLDTQAYNIFQPIETILPYELPQLLVEGMAPTPVLKSVKAAPSPFKKPEFDTYCKACKKKFSNEPTFTNHLKSAKHIANEKKSQPTKPAKPVQKIAVNPQVQDALIKMEKAQDPKMDSSQSITILWNVAQSFFVLKRPQYTEKALTLLINLLKSSPTTSFSSAQITSFLYNSRLSLARLLCIYRKLDESRSFYLDALDGKWKMETDQLIDIAKNLRALSITTLLSSCDALATKYLTRERNRTKPAPALTDVNNSISTILNEAGNLFAQENNVYNGIPSEHVAIVLYATCSLVCPYEQILGFSKESFYFIMSQVYGSLDDLTYREIEIKLLDMDSTWNVFNALLLSLEIDDLVRAKYICASLKNGEAYLYSDVKILCDLCDSKTTLNCCNLKQDLAYIQLLLQETNEALLIRDRSQKEQSYVLDRISELIA